MSTRKSSRRAAAAGIESVVKAEAESAAAADGDKAAVFAGTGSAQPPPNFPVYLHIAYKLAKSGIPSTASLSHVFAADNKSEVPIEVPPAAADEEVEEEGQVTPAERQAIRQTVGLPEDVRRRVLGDVSRAHRQPGPQAAAAGAQQQPFEPVPPVAPIRGGKVRPPSSPGEEAEEAAPAPTSTVTAERPSRRAKQQPLVSAVLPSVPGVGTRSAKAVPSPKPVPEPPASAAVVPPVAVAPATPSGAAVGPLHPPTLPPAISGSTEALPQQPGVPQPPPYSQPPVEGATPAAAGQPLQPVAPMHGAPGAVPQPAPSQPPGGDGSGVSATPHRGRGRPPKDPIAHAAVLAERERQRQEQAAMELAERQRHEARIIQEAQSIQDTAGMPMAMMPQPPQVPVPPQHLTIQVPVVAAPASLQHAVKLREMFLTNGPPPMPPCPWFDPEGIQQQEVEELKVCFPRLRSQSPVDPNDHDNVAYVTLRNTLIDVYRANADNRLTLAECRKHCDGDLSTLIRVLSFLERNALVNFALKAPPQLGPFGQPLPGTVSSQPYTLQQQQNKIKASLREQWGQTPRCTACGRVCLYSFFVLAPGVYGSALPALPQLRPSVWCGDCAREAPYSNCLSKVSLPALHVTGEVANWSETQLTTLFDAIESYGTDWFSVSKAVSGVPGNPVRSPSDCLAAFLAMPIAEPTNVPVIPPSYKARRISGGTTWDTGGKGTEEPLLSPRPAVTVGTGEIGGGVTAAQLTFEILQKALDLIASEGAAGGSAASQVFKSIDAVTRERLLRDLRRRVGKSRGVAITAPSGSSAGPGVEPQAGIPGPAAGASSAQGDAMTDGPTGETAGPASSEQLIIEMMARPTAASGSTGQSDTGIVAADVDLDASAAQLLSPTVRPGPPATGRQAATGSPRDVGPTPSGSSVSVSGPSIPGASMAGVSFHPPSSTGSSLLTVPEAPTGPNVILQGTHHAPPPPSSSAAAVVAPMRSPGASTVVSMGQPIGCGGTPSIGLPPLPPRLPPSFPSSPGVVPQSNSFTALWAGQAVTATSSGGSRAPSSAVSGSCAPSSMAAAPTGLTAPLHCRRVPLLRSHPTPNGPAKTGYRSPAHVIGPVVASAAAACSFDVTPHTGGSHAVATGGASVDSSAATVTNHELVSDLSTSVSQEQRHPGYMDLLAASGSSETPSAASPSV